MKVSYHGHSVVKIVTNGKTILIDPFITGNVLTDLHFENENPDAIILTHGHADHVGDTVEIAKRCNSLVIAPTELATYLGWQGLNTHAMHIGGAHEFEFGKVKLTPCLSWVGNIHRAKRDYLFRHAYRCTVSWQKERQFIMLVIRDYSLI